MDVKNAVGAALTAAIGGIGLRWALWLWKVLVGHGLAMMPQNLDARSPTSSTPDLA